MTCRKVRYGQGTCRLRVQIPVHFFVSGIQRLFQVVSFYLKGKPAVKLLDHYLTPRSTELIEIWIGKAEGPSCVSWVALLLNLKVIRFT